MRGGRGPYTLPTNAPAISGRMTNVPECAWLRGAGFGDVPWAEACRSLPPSGSMTARWGCSPTLGQAQPLALCTSGANSFFGRRARAWPIEGTPTPNAAAELSITHKQPGAA